MQYHGNPCVALRHKNPLPPLLDRDSGLSVEGTIPQWKLDPRVVGLKFKHSRAAITPGFWPGTELQHGYLAYLQRGHLKWRDDHLQNDQDHQGGLHCQALLHSFAWCLGQASYLGMTHFEMLVCVFCKTLIIIFSYFCRIWTIH